MNDDTIKRSDVYKAVADWLAGRVPNLNIKDIPSADRPQGEWKPFDLKWGRSIWYCTACEEGVEVPCDIWTHKPIYNFCPNCGADMREREGE